MKIRYKKAFGIFVVITSIFIVMLSFFLIASGYKPLYLLNLSTGIIFLIMGILYLRNIYFEVDDDRLVIYRLFGGEYRSYHLNSLHDLAIENNKIYLKNRGKKGKLPIYKRFVDPGDWQALAERIKKQE